MCHSRVFIFRRISGAPTSGATKRDRDISRCTALVPRKVRGKVRAVHHRVFCWDRLWRSN